MFVYLRRRRERRRRWDHVTSAQPRRHVYGHASPKFEGEAEVADTICEFFSDPVALYISIFFVAQKVPKFFEVCVKQKSLAPKKFFIDFGIGTCPQHEKIYG